MCLFKKGCVNFKITTNLIKINFSYLIQETNSGIIVKDSNHLLQVLGELYAEFEKNGFIACDSVGVEKYSRKIQVEKLAEIVKRTESREPRAETYNWKPYYLLGIDFRLL